MKMNFKCSLTTDNTGEEETLKIFFNENIGLGFSVHAAEPGMRFYAWSQKNKNKHPEITLSVLIKGEQTDRLNEMLKFLTWIMGKKEEVTEFNICEHIVIGAFQLLKTFSNDEFLAQEKEEALITGLRFFVEEVSDRGNLLDSLYTFEGWENFRPEIKEKFKKSILKEIISNSEKRNTALLSGGIIDTDRVLQFAKNPGKRNYITIKGKRLTRVEAAEFLTELIGEISPDVLFYNENLNATDKRCLMAVAAAVAFKRQEEIKENGEPTNKSFLVSQRELFEYIRGNIPKGTPAEDRQTERELRELDATLRKLDGKKFPIYEKGRLKREISIFNLELIEHGLGKDKRNKFYLIGGYHSLINLENHRIKFTLRNVHFIEQQPELQRKTKDLIETVLFKLKETAWRVQRPVDFDILEMLGKSSWENHEAGKRQREQIKEYLIRATASYPDGYEIEFFTEKRREKIRLIPKN